MVLDLRNRVPDHIRFPDIGAAFGQGYLDSKVGQMTDQFVNNHISTKDKSDEEKALIAQSLSQTISNNPKMFGEMFKGLISSAEMQRQQAELDSYAGLIGQTAIGGTQGVDPLILGQAINAGALKHGDAASVDRDQTYSDYNRARTDHQRIQTQGDEAMALGDTPYEDDSDNRHAVLKTFGDVMKGVSPSGNIEGKFIDDTVYGEEDYYKGLQRYIAMHPDSDPVELEKQFHERWLEMYNAEAGERFQKYAYPDWLDSDTEIAKKTGKNNDDPLGILE